MDTDPLRNILYGSRLIAMRICPDLENKLIEPYLNSKIHFFDLLDRIRDWRYGIAE